MNKNVDLKTPQHEQEDQNLETSPGLNEQLNTYEQSEHNVKRDLDKYAKMIRDTDLKVDQLREEIINQIDQATDRFNTISDDKSVPHEKLTELSDKINRLNSTLDSLKQNDSTIKHLRQGINKLKDELETINFKKDVAAKNLETLMYQEIALTSPNSVIADPNVSSSKYQLNKIRRSRQMLERQLDGFLRKIKSIEEKLKKNFAKLRKQRENIENFWNEHLNNNFRSDVQDQPSVELSNEDPWAEVLANDSTAPTEAVEPTEAGSTEPVEMTSGDDEPTQAVEDGEELAEADTADWNDFSGDEQAEQASEADAEESPEQVNNQNFNKRANGFGNPRFHPANNFNVPPNATRAVNFGNPNNQFNQTRPISFNGRFNQPGLANANRNPNFTGVNNPPNQAFAPNANRPVNLNFGANNPPGQGFGSDVNKNQGFARVNNPPNQGFGSDTNRNSNFVRMNNQPTQRFDSDPNKTVNVNFAGANNQVNQKFATDTNKDPNLSRMNNQGFGSDLSKTANASFGGVNSQVNQGFGSDINKTVNASFGGLNNPTKQVTFDDSNKNLNFGAVNSQVNQGFGSDINKTINASFGGLDNPTKQMSFDDSDKNLSFGGINGQVNQGFSSDIGKTTNFGGLNNSTKQVVFDNLNKNSDFGGVNSQVNQGFGSDIGKTTNFGGLNNSTKQVVFDNLNKNSDFGGLSNSTKQLAFDDLDKNLSFGGMNGSINQGFVVDTNKNPNLVVNNQGFGSAVNQSLNFAKVNNQPNQASVADVSLKNDLAGQNKTKSFNQGINPTFSIPESDEELFGDHADLLNTKSLEEELKSSLFAPENEKANLDEPPNRTKTTSFDKETVLSQEAKLGEQTDEFNFGDWPNDDIFSPNTRRIDFDKQTQRIKNLNFGEETKELGKNDSRSGDQLNNKSVNILNDNKQIVDERKTKNMDYNDNFSRNMGLSRNAGPVSLETQPNGRRQLTKKIGDVDFSQETLSNARPDFLKSERFPQTSRFNQGGRFFGNNQSNQSGNSSKNDQLFQNEGLLRDNQSSKTKLVDQGGRSFRNNQANQDDLGFVNEQVMSAWTTSGANAGENSPRFRQQPNLKSEINNDNLITAGHQKKSSKSKPNYYEFIAALDERLDVCKDFLESSEINATIVERFVKELNDISAYFQNLISQLQKNFSLVVLFKNDVLRLLPDKQKICDRFMNFNAKCQSAEAKKEYNFFFTFYDEFKRRFNSVRAKVFTDLDLFNSFTNDLKEVFEWVKTNISAEDPVFWIDCNELLEFWANLRAHYDRSGNNANALDSMLSKVLKKIENRLDNLDTDLENISNQVALVINDSDSFANIWDDSAAKVDELIGSVQTISNALSNCVQELNNIFDEAVRNIEEGSNTMVISQINRALEYFYNSKGVFANQVKDFDFRFSEVKYSYEQFLTKKQTIVEREKELNLAINSVNSNQYVLTEWIKQCRLTLDNSLNSLKIFSQKIALNQQRLFATYNAFLNKYTEIRDHVLALKEKEKWEKGIVEKEAPENHSFSVQKFFENSLSSLEDDKTSSSASILECEKIEEISKGVMRKTESLLRQLSEYNTGETSRIKSEPESVDVAKTY